MATNAVAGVPIDEAGSAIMPRVQVASAPASSRWRAEPSAAKAFDGSRHTGPEGHMPRLMGRSTIGTPLHEARHDGWKRPECRATKWAHDLDRCHGMTGP